MPRSRSPLCLAVALGSAVLLAACASGGADAQDAGSLEPPAPTSTSAPASTEPPTASPTPPSPSTASSSRVASEQLILHPEGLGNARFGDPPAVVVNAVSSVLGEPDEDSDWRPQAELQVHGACPGEFNRRVRWGQFVAVFTDGATDYAPGGQEHFFTWMVSAFADGEPSRSTPAATPDGIGVGSTTDDLRAAFGERRVTLRNPVEPDLDHPRFTVTAGRDVTLSGLLAGSRVWRLDAGSLCGE